MQYCTRTTIGRLAATPQSGKIRRPALLLLAGVAVASMTLPQVLILAGLNPGGSGHLEAVWGRGGLSPGLLQVPRAVAIDMQDRIFLVDKSARIQVFDRHGNYINGWRMPEHANGKPSGLTIARDGNLIVADTHYYRMLVYTPSGKLLPERTIGGQPGQKPGQCGWVTDVVEDSQGNYYLAEYGEFDRIQKFSPNGEFLFQWGGHGDKPGEFRRPQNLDIDEHNRIWVADACNHRIQVFDATGDEVKLVKIWGEEGEEVGQLRYPYDLVLDRKGHIYVCEFGNHRVQKLTLDGEPIGTWGTSGREEGQLYNPWALARDSRGRIHVVDSYNNRIQRIRM